MKPSAILYLFMSLITLSVAPFLASFAYAEVVNQEAFDVRLLAAGFTSRNVKVVASATQADQVSASSCMETGRHPRYTHGNHAYDYVDLDCTDAISHLLETPVISDVRVTVYVTPGTMNIIGSDPLYSGQVIEFLTVSRVPAFAGSTGIGFFLSSGMKWISKGDLGQVVSTKLATGDMGIVHRFAALSAGPVLSNLIFKPFISFASAGNIYNVWENLSPLMGRDFVTGGFGGSSNFQLISGRIDSIARKDLLENPDLITYPGSKPKLGEIRGDIQPIDIVTATLENGKISYQASLLPYSYGEQLNLSGQGFVEAGKRLWIRVNDLKADRRTVSLRYAVDGGAESEASYYMGGNCFGFSRCFQIDVPATAQSGIAFTVYLTGADGSVVVVDAEGAPFVTPVMAKTEASILVNSAGVRAERILPGSVALLSYDVRRAVEKVVEQGSYPGHILVKARVKYVDGTVALVPMGAISAGRDQDFNVTYQGHMGMMPVVVESNSTQMAIEFVLECSRNGMVEKTVIDRVLVDWE